MTTPSSDQTAAAGYRPEAPLDCAWPPLSDDDRTQLRELGDWLRMLSSLDDRPQHAQDGILIARLVRELGEWHAAADMILREHWKTRATWGGVLSDVCGRCTYGDGVPYRWPCPTRRALTGEPEPTPLGGVS